MDVQKQEQLTTILMWHAQIQTQTSADIHCSLSRSRTLIAYCMIFTGPRIYITSFIAISHLLFESITLTTTINHSSLYNIDSINSLVDSAKME